MKTHNYEIISVWGTREEPPVEIGRKFLDTLDGLERIDPLFCDWGTNDPFPPDWETREPDDEIFISRPLNPLRKDFTPFVEQNVSRDDWGEPEPQFGYDLFAFTRYGSAAAPDPLAIAVCLTAGSVSKNTISFAAAPSNIDPDPAIVTFPIFKSALLTLLSIWPALSANVRFSIWGEKPPTLPGEPPFPYSGYQMPWMAYLCAERAARVSLPADILTERTADGGLLMIATEERFDPTNRQHMAHSRVLAEIMIAHGEYVAS